MKRVTRIFRAVLSHAAKRLFWLAGRKVHACWYADAEHQDSWRQFAHQGHRLREICFARAAETELTDQEIVGLCAHELGHVVGEAIKLKSHLHVKAGKTPAATQRDADKISEVFFGIKLRYNKRKIQVPVTPFRISGKGR